MAKRKPRVKALDAPKAKERPARQAKKPDSLKVKFLRKDGNYLKGQTYELRTAEAEKFIRQGVAEEING